MNSLHLSPKALADLAEIKEYIAWELENPTAAINTVGKITKNMRILEHHAEAGALLSLIADVGTDYRFLISGNYLTFYRVHGTDIYVDRVLYGRRDHLRILFDNPV